MTRNAPARRLARLIRKNPLVPWWRTCRRRSTEFQFEGQTYHYFFHRCNRTWTNERAVELPIAWRALGTHSRDSRESCRILEVGNVLTQYFDTSHLVVDKYERSPGVVNQDIVDLEDGERFSFIVSISTLEHVGWDERPQDANKIPRAVKRMRELLRPGGELLVTVPLGYNPHLDELIVHERLGFDSQAYLLRISSDNQWRQATIDEVTGAAYNAPFDWANALAVCRYRATQ